MNLLQQLGSLNQSFLWASLIWGTVASGYLIYGWKQQSLIPFVGGLIMLAVSCFTPALTMTVISILVMAGVWWLLKQES